MSPFRFALLLSVVRVLSAYLIFPAPGPKTASDPDGKTFSCIPSKNRIEADGCEVVTLPAEFCAACQVVVLQESGRYGDCTRASWSLENDNGECLSKFAEYSALNTCDPERAIALDTYLNPANEGQKEDARQQLDFLVYALCENMCDCVPQRPANPRNKRYDVTRGSCQGHAQGALCRSYPNVKLIRGEGDPPDDVSALPTVCPQMQAWFDAQTISPIQIFTGADIEPEVSVFLDRMLRAGQIREDNTLWEECLHMERKASVEVRPALETVYPDINCRPVTTSGCPDPFREVVMKRTDSFGACSDQCVSHRMVPFYKEVLGYDCGTYCD